ncbi:MAG: histidine phosphatase family protein [Acidimicrobiales bacterium]
MLVLARHGQTAANAAGLLLGRADPILTRLGRRQAAAIALAVPSPSVLVSSPLLRATQSAEAWGCEVTVDERWIEIDYGDWDQMSLDAVPAAAWRQWREDPGFRAPGGESLCEVGQRVRDACEELVGRAAEEQVVVVTHVSPLKAAVAWALGVGDEVAWRLFCAVGSISRIAVGGPSPVLASFNEIGHLRVTRDEESVGAMHHAPDPDSSEVHDGRTRR